VEMVEIVILVMEDMEAMVDMEELAVEMVGMEEMQDEKCCFKDFTFLYHNHECFNIVC
jgi:hypothetical protein